MGKFARWLNKQRAEDKIYQATLRGPQAYLCGAYLDGEVSINGGDICNPCAISSPRTGAIARASCHDEPFAVHAYRNDGPPLESATQQHPAHTMIGATTMTMQQYHVAWAMDTQDGLV